MNTQQTDPFHNKPINAQRSLNEAWQRACDKHGEEYANDIFPGGKGTSRKVAGVPIGLAHEFGLTVDGQDSSTTNPHMKTQQTEHDCDKCGEHFSTCICPNPHMKTQKDPYNVQAHYDAASKAIANEHMKTQQTLIDGAYKANTERLNALRRTATPAQAHSPLPDASALDKTLVDQINILKHDLTHWKDDHEKLSRLAANEIKKRMDSEAHAQRLADALRDLTDFAMSEGEYLASLRGFVKLKRAGRLALAQWEGEKQ